MNSKRHKMSLKFNPCSDIFKNILKICFLGILLLMLYIKSKIEVLKRYSWFDIPLRSISPFLNIISLAIIYYWVKMSSLIFEYLNLPEIKTKYPIYRIYTYNVYTNIQYIQFKLTWNNFPYCNFNLGKINFILMLTT